MIQLLSCHNEIEKKEPDQTKRKPIENGPTIPNAWFVEKKRGRKKTRKIFAD